VPEDCKDLVNRVENFFPESMHKELIHQIRPVKILANSGFYLSRVLEDPKQTNSSIIVHFQEESPTERSEVIGDFIISVLKAPIFGRLRTEEQLGYLVWTT
jgi:secreted Zn-dependent insulinase-like peptidase